jgi:U3 small nucleolar ribonucleoprotein component
VPPPPEEEEDEVVDAPVIPMEEYQPPNLSGEEALRRDIEESELAELGN